MIKKIMIFVILMILVLPITVSSQPTNLTDREVLIQMYEKITYIEETTNRINNNQMKSSNKIIQVESRVVKNEVEIKNILERIKELVLRWNTLLGLFATFILGIFVWMWRSVAYRKNNSKVKSNTN